MDTDINNPLISAIMIVYNGEKYIEPAIESVLNQTHKNFELLILNDGSNDQTEKIILSKVEKDKRIKYFRNEINRGLSYSRNKIINLTNSNYIAVTDADDINLVNRFEKQIKVLVTQPDVDILGSCLTMMDGTGKEQAKWDYPLNNNEIKEGLKSSCALANPSCMFKKEVFLKVNGYNESLTFCEDWDFFYRAASNFNFKNLPDALVKYRIHGNNMSKKKLEETVVFSLYITHALAQDCLSYDIKKIISVYPELVKATTQKSIKFYSFWIEIYCKLGYKKLSEELYSQVQNIFFPFFSKPDRKLFLKQSMLTALKNFNLKMLLMSFKKYIIK